MASPSGTGHDTAEPICPGCKRPVSECRAEDVDDPLFPVPADPVVSPADTIRQFIRYHARPGNADHFPVEVALDALLAVVERDRQHIARAREIVEAATPGLSIPPADCTDHCSDGDCDCSGEFRIRAWVLDMAALRAVLADKEDAGTDELLAAGVEVDLHLSVPPETTLHRRGRIRSVRAAGEGDT